MLIESKSALARLMATENLFVEQRKVPTAFFDIQNRVLTIPILKQELSSELYDLLIGHETGHALETPAEGWHDSIVDLKVNRTILNVCEDARIEKKIKRKFPGLRASFIKGYRELMEMDFFGVKYQDLNTLNFIDRVNLHTKGGVSQGIRFSREEEFLLKEVEEAETFEETVQVAMKIQKFMKENAKNKTNPRQYNTKPVKDPYVMSMDDEIEDEYFDLDDDSDTQEDSDEDSQENEDENDFFNSGSLSAGDIQSVTDKNFRKNEHELFSEENRENIYCNIPKVLTEDLIVSYKYLIKKLLEENETNPHYDQKILLSNYNTFKAESNKVVSYLIKEFELRKNAEQQARVQIARTGNLNLKKIHEYRFSDDIFARLTKVPNGKSHGLVIFVDWSGSMQDNINATIKQLLNLALFCKKANIPFEVYGFSTHCVFKQGCPDQLHAEQVRMVGNLEVHRFSLLNIFSSKMSAKEFTFMASNLLSFSGVVGRIQKEDNYCQVFFPKILHLGGTPLNEAIIASFELLSDFKKQNKLEIVNTVFLTDGNGGMLQYRIESVTDSRWENISHRYRSNIWFRDPVTKASVKIVRKGDNDDYSANQTIGLLKLLKQRIGCNIIGFYICSNTKIAKEGIQAYSENEGFREKHSVEYSRNKFTVLSNIGFDDYYFIRSTALNIEDDEFEVTENQMKSNRALASAFSKYTSSRLMNRVVLNRFIGLIA
jgi:hypothetical protein